MGLFSRKESSTGRSRPMVSSEAQAADLRARARRRLVGAVALVLSAVVILPMVLKPEPDRVQEDIPVRIPELEAQVPYTAQIAPQAMQPDGMMPGAVQPGGVRPPPPLSGDGSSGIQDPVAPPPETAPTPSPSESVESQTTPAPVATAPKPTPEPKPAPKPAPTRTDDGERALALLEGRDPPPATKPAARPVEKGNFVLQIASYSARGDADGRRAKLHEAGVTNAFVQAAQVSGKEQFRLRVGPFPSRDAASAAQARLRTLGYDNGFIAAQ